MLPSNPSEWFGVARTILAALGGWAAARGWVSPEMVPEAIGAIIVLVTAIWSVIAKRQATP